LKWLRVGRVFSSGLSFNYLKFEIDIGDTGAYKNGISVAEGEYGFGLWKDYRGVSVYGFTKNLLETYGWLIVTEQDEEELMRPIKATRTYMIIASIILFLIILAVVFFPFGDFRPLVVIL
jgi:hypothetical protein